MPPTIPTPEQVVLRVNPPLPRDPALRAIADEVLAQVKYTIVAHAAGEAGGTGGALDRDVAEFMATRTAATRERYRAAGRTTLAAPLAKRTEALGRYAGVPVDRYRTLGSDRLSTSIAAPAIDRVRLEAALAALRRDLTKVPSGFVLKPPASKPGQKIVLGPGAVDLMAGLKFHKLRLILSSVHCFEETDGAFEGSDEISLGGSATSANGKTAFVNQFKVSEDFDEGETVQFPGGRTFATWDLALDKDWPHVYGAVIAMAEKDDGGFYAFLKKLWAKVEAKVKAAVEAAVGAGVGAAIGGAFGGIIGAIAGGLIGALIGWLISLFDNPDDILGVAVLTMSLAAATKSYYDWAKLTAAGGIPVVIDFTGGGGHYRLKGAYRVAAT